MITRLIFLLPLYISGDCAIPTSIFRSRRASVEIGLDFSYEELYFKQPIDHFNFFSNETFSMRYLINKDSWNDGGPILFYSGGEGDITWFCNNTGFMWEIAPEFEAMIIFAEHRYYGESMPFGNESYKAGGNLRFLSAEQAMLDYVKLLRHIKSTISGAKLSPVLAFGGSYGGMLAAWMRMKYPHIIMGSLASSAPLLMFSGMSDCGKFNEIITKDFEDVSYECAKYINQSWEIIDHESARDNGMQWISNTFHLCKPLNSSKHINEFKYWLTNVWVNLAEVNYPYPTSFLQHLPAWPIKKACQYLNSSSLKDKDILIGIQKITNLFFNYTGEVEDCFDHTQLYKDPYIHKGWSYQACTEMIMPFCSKTSNAMFPPEDWNFAAYSDYCFQSFGVRPNKNWGEELFGGANINAASNIIFTNGKYDPWIGYGIVKNYSSSVIAFVINDGAHHVEIRSTHKDDTPAITNTRTIIKEHFRMWIRQYREQNNITTPKQSKVNIRRTHKTTY